MSSAEDPMQVILEVPDCLKLVDDILIQAETLEWAAGEDQVAVSQLPEAQFHPLQEEVRNRHYSQVGRALGGL